MPQSVINQHTDENIKNFLLEENEREKEDAAGFPDRRNSESGNSSSSSSNNKKGIFRNKKLVFLGLFLVLAAVTAAAYFTHIKGQQSFDGAKVKVEIEAPREITSGEEIIFNIKYKNDTEVELRNPKISLFIPKEFIFISSDQGAQKETAVISWKLKNISAGGSGGIKLFGKIIGKKDSAYGFNSKISYIPNNFNYEFESADNLSKTELKITSVPFELSVKASESAVSGDEVEYLISYKNVSDHGFKKIKIKAQFPEGFSYLSSLPEASKKENYLSWDIENLNSSAHGELTVEGNLIGEKGDKKRTVVVLEASESDEDLVEYAAEEVSTEIQEAPVVFSQTVNGLDSYSADRGEELEYKIGFKNTSGKEIRGLVINSQLDGEADLGSLEAMNGSYDDKYKMTWSAFNVPKLAVLPPQEGGEVSFKIKVKDYIDVKSPSDKNFIIKNKATMSIFNFNSDSLKIEKIIASGESTVNINGSLFIKAKGYFNDDGRIVNGGLIPPEAGKETDYSIHWNLSGLLNDIRNIRIVSTLPERVNWTGNYIKPNGEISLGGKENGTFTPSQTKEAESGTEIIRDPDLEDAKPESDLEERQIGEERFYYDAETREVVWEIPKLDANTGTFSPAKEVVFQVSVAPQETDVGNFMAIMNKIEAEGYDDFTGKKIAVSENGLTTELPDDVSIGAEGEVVIKSSGEEN